MRKITNSHRAECAAHALDAYGLVKEGRADYDPSEDMAGDLICDLLHLLRAHDRGDPLKKLETARMHFEAEEAEETNQKKPKENAALTGANVERNSPASIPSTRARSKTA